MGVGVGARVGVVVVRGRVVSKNKGFARRPSESLGGGLGSESLGGGLGGGQERRVCRDVGNYK